jgi:lactoylglutathione lyase
MMGKVLLLLIVSCLAFMPLKSHNAEEDRKLIEASWIPTSFELSGQKLPEAAFKDTKLVLADGRYTYQNDHGTYKLIHTDDPKDQKAMNITGTEGPNQGKTFMAIYELTGDTLRICYDLAGKTRPKEFTTKAGTKEFLATYKREQVSKPSDKSSVRQQPPSNRKEQSMELGNFSISLAVKDIEASKSFYEKFGFKVFMGDAAQKWLIMKNGDHVIGLFQGMFEKNIMTFNPGWDSNGQNLPTFTDVRELQRQLKAKGVKLQTEADENTTGPASFISTGEQHGFEPRNWARGLMGSAFSTCVS